MHIFLRLQFPVIAEHWKIQKRLSGVIFRIFKRTLNLFVKYQHFFVFKRIVNVMFKYITFGIGYVANSVGWVCLIIGTKNDLLYQILSILEKFIIIIYWYWIKYYRNFKLINNKSSFVIQIWLVIWCEESFSVF